MPFISTERVKEIRNEIKRKYPKFKFSITNQHYSVVKIIIQSGPIQMLTSKSGEESVNVFYIKEHYEDFPEIRDILQDIYNIANKGNGILVIDGDYGAVPNFYVNISIGDYNKPYEVKQ